MVCWRMRKLFIVILLFLIEDRGFVKGKISILKESDAVARRRELRSVMGRWSQSLSDESDEQEFKELKAESSPLGIVEAGRYLIDKDILNR